MGRPSVPAVAPRSIPSAPRPPSRPSGPRAVVSETFGAPASASVGAAPRYAGFWRRFWAVLLDAFLLFVGLVCIGTLALAPLGGFGTRLDGVESSRVAYFCLVWFALLFGIPISYFSSMESSRCQATLGKLMLGIRVTDNRGLRVSFARALGRRLSHAVTELTLGLGYVMVVFTHKKQALHDMIAGTLVVRSGADA